MLNPNEFIFNQALNLNHPDQITIAIQTALAMARPRLFDNEGLCAGYPLTPSPDEYFIAHEVNSEKMTDLRQALEQGLANTQFKPYTADQDIRPGHILCKIAAKIQTTAFCIFDLPKSPIRPGANNVYLELGIAIGLGRPFVLIKSDPAQPASLLGGLDTFGFSSYSRLRKEVSERVQVGQFSAILPQEDVLPTPTYFLAEGEFEQEDFQEAIQNALQTYGLEQITLDQAPVGSDLVLTQLIRRMQSARFGIVRVDERSSVNTFLTLGIAIGLNKPWLLVAREGAAIPQDVRGLSNFNFRSFTQLETDLAGRCQVFLQRYASEGRPPLTPKLTPVNPTPDLAAQERYKTGIPASLLNAIRQALLDCGSFNSDLQAQAVFADARLSPWRYNLPQANSVSDRVDAVINFLYTRESNQSQGNGLVLLLQVLSERTDPVDQCHTRLAILADELQRNL